MKKSLSPARATTPLTWPIPVLSAEAKPLAFGNQMALAVAVGAGVPGGRHSATSPVTLASLERSADTHPAPRSAMTAARVAVNLWGTDAPLSSMDALSV